MDVCVCVYSVLSCLLVAALRRADHSSKESYRPCKKDYETDEEDRAQQRAVEPLINEWMNEICLDVVSVSIIYYRIKT
jgi:hypothetical protein